MSEVKAHLICDLDETGADDTARLLATVITADATAVATVLEADPESEDGRSPWMWVRMANGDLILGTYPQGDTYFAAEYDHSDPAKYAQAAE